MPGRTDTRSIEHLQTMRLARTVLDQPDAEVGRLVDVNPALVAEWADELAARRRALLAEADQLARAADRLKRHATDLGRSAA